MRGTKSHGGTHSNGVLTCRQIEEIRTIPFLNFGTQVVEMLYRKPHARGIFAIGVYRENSMHLNVAGFLVGGPVSHPFVYTRSLCIYGIHASVDKGRTAAGLTMSERFVWVEVFGDCAQVLVVNPSISLMIKCYNRHIDLCSRIFGRLSLFIDVCLNAFTHGSWSKGITHRP